MQQQDARRRGARDLGAHHEFPADETERHGADEPHEERQRDEGDDEDGREDAGPEHGRDEEPEHERREGEHHVREAHDCTVDEAADIGREHAQAGPDERRGEHRDRRDQERGPDAVDDARQERAAELVGAERELPGRRRQTRPDGDLFGIADREQVAEGAQEHDGREQREGRGGQRIEPRRGAARNAEPGPAHGAPQPLHGAHDAARPPMRGSSAA